MSVQLIYRLTDFERVDFFSKKNPNTYFSATILIFWMQTRFGKIEFLAKNFHETQSESEPKIKLKIKFC